MRRLSLSMFRATSNTHKEQARTGTSLSLFSESAVSNLIHESHTVYLLDVPEKRLTVHDGVRLVDEEHAAVGLVYKRLELSSSHSHCALARHLRSMMHGADVHRLSNNRPKRLSPSVVKSITSVESKKESIRPVPSSNQSTSLEP